MNISVIIPCLYVTGVLGAPTQEPWLWVAVHRNGSRSKSSCGSLLLLAKYVDGERKKERMHVNVLFWK